MIDVQIQPRFSRSQKKRTPFQFSLRTLFVAITVVSVMCGAAAWFRQAMKPRFGINAEEQEWSFLPIPSQAQNVSFYDSGLLGPQTAFEFDIGEEEFCRWSEDRGWQTDEIDSTISMERFNLVSRDSRKLEKIGIRSGLSYSYVVGDYGIYVAYDRDHGRAYFFNHTR